MRTAGELVACFKWPEAALRGIHNASPHELRIGVPQGGAISGVIANLILDAADKAVEEERARLGAQIHYFRYCDDMIVFSPSREHCQAAYGTYQAALKTLKLPYHEPKRTFIYGKSHWDHKSKAPYCWSGREWFGCVPWVQFVGYQIRYDGLMRPRKESVKKQAAKLVETTGIVKSRLLESSIDQPILATKNQAIMSLKSKLVAQGVGRVKGQTSTGPLPMCWASGFKALHNKPFVSGALRLLDRIRQKQIGRFANAQIRYGIGRTSRGHHRHRNPTGYTFSYHAQFANQAGQNLILNPWRPSTLKDKLKQLVFSLVTGTMIKRWHKNIRIKISKALRAI
jgi:Reverse transcriptase (RNA-dependent DNA polymerase)